MGARLVFGGGDRGLMGRAARAAMAAGGEVAGIIPGFSGARQAYLDWSELVVVENMHQRKQRMFDARTRSWRCRAASARWRNWSSN